MSNAAPVQHPLSLCMPLASVSHVPAVLQALQAHQEAFSQALTSISTVHFARFVLLTNNPALGLPIGDAATLALFTEYDGSFTVYVKDFVAKLGPIFDALLQYVASPPPLPVADYPDEFVAWVKTHDLSQQAPDSLPRELSFYSAYPTLSVVDIVGMSQLA